MGSRNKVERLEAGAAASDRALWEGTGEIMALSGPASVVVLEAGPYTCVVQLLLLLPLPSVSVVPGDITKLATENASVLARTCAA